MVIMILILIFLAVACIVDLYINRKIYTPTLIFNFIWFVVLALYQFKLSHLQHDLSIRTMLVLIVCILSYNVTFLIMKLIKERNKEDKEQKQKKHIFNINIKTRFTVEQKVKFFKYVAIVVFIIEVIYSKGVPLLWKFLGTGKTYFDFGIPSINGALYGLIICLGAYSIFSKSKDKYIYLLMGILMVSRQVLMSMFIEAIVFTICDFSKKIDYRKYAIILVVLLLGFSVIGNFRSGSNEIDMVFYAKEEYKELPTTVKWVYSYVTFSITNLDNLINMTDGRANFGATMISDILPTVVTNIINIKVNQYPYYLELGNFNVSTYLPSVYLDFGIIGVGIFNAILAILGKTLYDMLTKDNNARNRLLYAVFAHNILLLFFINMFLYLPIVVQFVYILIIFGVPFGHVPFGDVDKKEQLSE